MLSPQTLAWCSSPGVPYIHCNPFGYVYDSETILHIVLKFPVARTVFTEKKRVQISVGKWNKKKEREYNEQHGRHKAGLLDIRLYNHKKYKNMKHRQICSSYTQTVSERLTIADISVYCGVSDGTSE